MHARMQQFVSVNSKSETVHHRCSPKFDSSTWPEANDQPFCCKQTFHFQYPWNGSTPLFPKVMLVLSKRLALSLLLERSNFIISVFVLISQVLLAKPISLHCAPSVLWKKKSSTAFADPIHPARFHQACYFATSALLSHIKSFWNDFIKFPSLQLQHCSSNTITLVILLLKHNCSQHSGLFLSTHNLIPLCFRKTTHFSTNLPQNIAALCCRNTNAILILLIRPLLERSQ